MLHNENYTSDYIHGRRQVDGRSERMANGRPNVRRANDDEVRRIVDHHEPFVTKEEFAEIQRIVATNAPAKARRNLGPGIGLVQGILRCAPHDKAMSIYYHSREQKLRSFHGYQCPGHFGKTGGGQCGRTPGYHLDLAVRRAVIARLCPPALSALHDEWREARTEAQNRKRRRSLQIDRARREVEEAKRRALAIDPGLGRVARELNRLWEDAEKRLEKLEPQPDTGPSIIETFNEDSWAQARELAADIDAIWDADTTEHRDRKEIVRLVVEVVLIEERSDEQIRARVIWTDDTPDTTLDIKLPPYGRKLIREWFYDGLDAVEITRQLNDRGIVTTQGNPWSKPTVQGVIRQLTRQASPE